MKEIPFYLKHPTSNAPHEDFGAPNAEEYEKWAPNICSICCLKMVGDAFGVSSDASLYELTMRAINAGVFREDEETGEILGAYHVPLVKLAESLGLKGKVEKRLAISKIISLLDDGKFILLSVDKSKIDPEDEGGHLILVHRYDPERRIFIVHDPEPILNDNGENVEVDEDSLSKFSNQRGISLWME